MAVLEFKPSTTLPATKSVCASNMNLEASSMNSYDKVLPMNTQPTHNDYKLPSSVASKFLNKLVYLEKLAEARRGAHCTVFISVTQTGQRERLYMVKFKILII